MYDLDGRAADEPAEVTIGYVGGGSRDWARTLMNDLAQTTAMRGEVRLYDVDYESAKRNEELGELYGEQEEVVGDWTYRAVRNLEDALDGADFVLLSTQDPPAETMAHDLELPAEYGIYQTVGDTVGPGGTLRSMRSIPQYRAIAAAVREHCPDAWVLNFSNPMTVITRTLYEEFPEINAVGICHEVYHAKDYLASLVEKHRGVEDVDGAEIDVSVSGINHFTWITEVRYRGEDVFPVLDAELAEQEPLPGGFEVGDLDDDWYMIGHQQVAIDLYRRFGAFPAAGDRHLMEFVPWYLDVDRPEAVQRWGVRITPSEYRIDHWPENEREREAILDGEARIELRDSGEEMVALMEALLGLAPLKTNVNVPNRGQVPDLQEGAVVETNALVTANRITPLATEPLPDQVTSLLRPHVTNQEALVEAGFDGDVDRAYRAYLNDPLVTIGPEAARALFGDLVEIQRPYLEDWNLEGSAVLAEAAED